VAFDPGTTNVTTALTGFQTFGDMMDGMSVTVTFSDNSTENAIWGDTGPGSGGASGTGWSLSQSGDTFGGNWVLINSNNLGITNVAIDAGVGDTVFDTTFNGFGTDGSANGITFVLQSGGTGLDIVATYSNYVALSGDAPVGDLFRNLNISLATSGGAALVFVNGGYIGRDLQFDADTDNLKFGGDIRPVPEPGSMILLGSGLVGAGRIIRKKLSK
jgi:hypothetical protein